MARTPILARRGYFDYVNRNNPVTRILDWNTVDTELGPMCEPRQEARYLDGVVTQVDMLDAAYDSNTYLDANTFYSSFGTDGQQIMRDWNY